MTGTEESAGQEEVVDFLGSCDSAGVLGVAKIVQTHGALIFLHANEALKIKRAVKYNYLDYSTRELRHKMLLRELALNHPVAPTLYRDVVPVTRAADGGLTFNGTGPPVEWVLRMARFPAAAELSVMAETGKIDDALAAALGTSVAVYHARAPRRDEDGAALTAEIIDELERVFHELRQVFDDPQVMPFISAARQAALRQRALLSDRSAAGFVRRGHGDLHLANLVMFGGRPTLYDALEFDERLGTCDLLYDLAFLLMDLMHLGLRRQANGVLNAYLAQEAKPEAFSGLAALPLFLALRAAIRAMVDVQKSRFDETPETARADARAYLRQALRYLDSPPAKLIALGGLSGSGKTSVARAIAPLLGAAPGAVHLRSDLLRKALFGVAPLVRLPQAAYRPDVSAGVYAELRTRAATVLASGHSVVLDAVHATEAERAACAQIAQGVGCRFQGIWLDVPVKVMRARIEGRCGDASDADLPVLQRQIDKGQRRIAWLRIDGSGTVEDVAQTILAELSQSG